MPENNAEERMHPLLEKHELSLPVRLSPLPEGLLQGYPRLKPLDFLEFMKASGNLNRLLGGRQIEAARPFLQDFWKRYEVCHPDFSLFKEECDLSSCIPVYVHADGGRGVKKSEFMVFNWSSAIGCGTGRANKKDHSLRSFNNRRRKEKAQINLLGHTYTTHYLYGVMPAAWHKDDSKFQAMMDAFGQDLAECHEPGILTENGGRVRLVVLGLKADLKLQARAGRFTRWYSTCRKAPHDPNKRNQTSGYCCWLCPAGHIDYPFEEIHTESPAWFQEMGTFARVPPWKPGEDNGLVRYGFKYDAHLAKFYLPDLFHIYLAGFGQDYAASCLVYMLGKAFPGTSVEAQLASLNSSWRLWKGMNKVTTHTYYFTRLLLNFLDGSKVYPTGTWSKASDTAKICNFIVHICSLYEDRIATDKGLSYINIATTALGVCMRGLYDADLWVEAW